VTIKLERRGDGWVVMGESVLSTSPELADAALSASFLAELYGTTVELGGGVPHEVLEQAERRRARLTEIREDVRVASRQ
jgi:hypothetical protein